MKKKLRILSVVLSMVLVLGALGLSGLAKEEKRVDVMFTHDTHSHLNNFSRIKTLIDKQKSENPDTLLLDGGDFSMGTLVQVMFREEASELRMFGALGMDATTFGNHEYDYRSDGLAGMLKSAKDSGDILPAMVVCNVDWKAMEAEGLSEEQKLLKEAFDQFGVKDYVVTEKNGVSIAITGAFGVDALDCAPTCALLFRDAKEAVRETVQKIQKNEKVDMIVCVSHSGTWDNPKKSEDELLAKAVPELDLIISGHTHTKLEKPICHGNTYIVSCGEQAKYLGSLSMKQQKGGRWKLDKYELLEVKDSIAVDQTIQEKVDGFMNQVDSKYVEQFGMTHDQVLCKSDFDFVPHTDTEKRHEELNLGSIMADSYVYAVSTMSDDDPNPVDVAVVPSGTIRDTYKKGNVTVEDVFNSFSLGIGPDKVPGYPLISVYLTGAELKTAAEIDATVSDLMTTARLYTYGLYWNFNPNRMILNKVTDVYICNSEGKREEIDDKKLYRVITDLYSAQMLGSVTDMSYGMLSLVPKHADGTPITDYNASIVKAGDQELKVWWAIASYMNSFEDTDGDGVGDVPAKYNTQEGRKVVEDSKKIGDLLKNPNKFFFMIIGVVVLIIAILIGIVTAVVKIVKKIVKCGKKHEGEMPKELTKQDETEEPNQDE